MKKIFLRRKLVLNIVVITFIGLVSCNSNKQKETTETETTADTSQPSSNTVTPPPIIDTTPKPMVQHAEATLTGTYPDTSVTGTVKFDADSAKGKVKMTLEITVPAKAGKSVAVHIHEHGDCGDKAELAHGHWNPTNAQHGKWGSASFHAGDIGNVKLDSKGNGKMSLTTDLWTLGGMASKNILGKSIIVHGGMDDYKTQPSGNSGARIGCGVIR